MPYTRRIWGLGLLVLTSTVVGAAGCDSDDDTARGDGADGGSAGSTNGSSGNGNGASGSGSATGGFDSIWKAASSDVLLIDPANPTQLVNPTIEMPDTLPGAADGEEFDVYLQIEDDTLITYGLRVGDSSYYRISEPLQKLDDTTYAFTTFGNEGARYYMLEDGLLVDTSNAMVGEFVVSTRTTYARHTGAFPPDSWPSELREVGP